MKHVYILHERRGKFLIFYHLFLNTAVYKLVQKIRHVPVCRQSCEKINSNVFYLCIDVNSVNY